METVQQMAEFVCLWVLVQLVQLNEQRSDSVEVDSGREQQYTITTKSVYQAQSKGSYCSFKVKSIWRVHAEGKLKFFAWLPVQAPIQININVQTL